MNIAKDYGEIPSYHYTPELNACPYCGGELERSHPVWAKTIVSMGETAKVTNWGYRCENRETTCPQPEMVYRSGVADGLALTGYTFGLDVIVFVGQQRFGKKQTLGEIHAALKAREVPISERRVADYIEEYQMLLKCAHGAKLEAYRDQIEENGGIVLAIDGAQPEKGKATLYLFRDVLTGARLHAVSLWHNDTDSLAAEMEAVQAVVDRLGVPVLGVISDDQDAIRCGAMTWRPFSRS